jgi:hypothetical protein
MSAAESSEVSPHTHGLRISIWSSRLQRLSAAYTSRPIGRELALEMNRDSLSLGRNAALLCKLGIILIFSGGNFSVQNTSMKRSAVFVAGALTLAGAFFAGAAYAAAPRLDEATDLITKAVAVLKAAENPDPKKEFGGHRKTAIELLTRAQGEILKANEFADKPTPKDPKPPVTKP